MRGNREGGNSGPEDSRADSPLVTELCWAGTGRGLLAGEGRLLRGSKVKGAFPPLMRKDGGPSVDLLVNCLSGWFDGKEPW